MKSTHSFLLLLCTNLIVQEERENKMPETINIQEYLTEGVEAIVKDALRATLRDPKESLFMARFAAASRKASERRARNEKDGLHVPSYLIASITSSCNLCRLLLPCESCHGRL